MSMVYEPNDTSYKPIFAIYKPSHQVIKQTCRYKPIRQRSESESREYVGWIFFSISTVLEVTPVCTSNVSIPA